MPFIIGPLFRSLSQEKRLFGIVGQVPKHMARTQKVIWNIWTGSGFGKTAQGRCVDDQQKFGQDVSVQICITERPFSTDDSNL